MKLPRWANLLLVLLTLLGFVWLLRVHLTVNAPQALSSGQELLKSQRVLALVAHPDDLDWYIGGTLHRLAQQGADVTVIVSSNGESGPNQTAVSDLASERQAEQRRAGAINGYSHIYFLGLPDRQVARAWQLIPRVDQIYQQLRPQAVFIFDPDYPSYPYLHADHQGSARAFVRYWQGLDQASRPPLYLFQTRQPNTAVDISSVIDSKEQAMNQHVTQGGGGPMLRRMFALDGRTVGVPYAELFRKVEPQATQSH